MFSTLLFLGILAATDLFVALVPKAEGFVESLKPYRGWIGLVFAATGVMWLLWWLFGVWAVFGGWGFPGIGNKIRGILWGLTWLGVALLQASIGFLVGFEKIAELSGKGSDMEPLRRRLAPYQRTLGMVAVGFALWTFFGTFLLIPTF
jgi:hypothetical protein